MSKLNFVIAREYNPAHYTFARKHSGDAPEPTDMPRSVMSIVGHMAIGALILAGIAMVML